MYRDFLAAGREGLQHVAVWTADIDEELARVERATGRSFEVAQSGAIGEKGRFVYLDTEAHAGTVVEVSEVSGAKGRSFERIAAKAAAWDGRDAVRRH